MEKGQPSINDDCTSALIHPQRVSSCVYEMSASFKCKGCQHSDVEISKVSVLSRRHLAETHCHMFACNSETRFFEQLYIP